MAVGKIVQVQGPVVDAEFAPGELPNILNALTITDAGRNIDLTVEVSQHLGNDVVRCIAMSTTDGLTRGMAVNDTGGVHLRARRQRDPGPRLQHARQAH